MTGIENLAQHIDHAGGALTDFLLQYVDRTTLLFALNPIIAGGLWVGLGMLEDHGAPRWLAPTLAATISLSFLAWCLHR